MNSEFNTVEEKITQQEDRAEEQHTEDKKKRRKIN